MAIEVVVSDAPADFRQRIEEAKAGGAPVLDAMRRWLDHGRVPRLNEFLVTYGTVFGNYRYGLPSGRAGVRDSLANFYQRDGFIEEFGFSLPCSEALDVLERHAPILEIGAGSGYWSALMACRGIDVVATDPAIEKFKFETGRYFPIVSLQGKTAVRRHSDRNVFCSWPSLTETWLRQAARAMRPGRTLIVVREDATADERTWNYLEMAFRFIGDCRLPCWWGLHDRIEIWKKRARPVAAEVAAAEHWA